MPLSEVCTAQGFGFARAHNYSSADAALGLGLERSALMEKKPVSEPSLPMETQNCWDSADMLKDNTSDLLMQDGCLGFGECSRLILDGSENSSHCHWNVIDSECAGAWHQKENIESWEQYCNSCPRLMASLSCDLAEACFRASQGDLESEFDVGFF